MMAAVEMEEDGTYLRNAYLMCGLQHLCMTEFKT